MQMALNFEGLEMQKWNIPTERAQRVDKKNGVICLIIMFTPRIAVIIDIKGLFFVFPADDSKIVYHSLGKIFKCIWKNLFGSFRKCYGLLGSEVPWARCQALKTQYFSIFADSAGVFYISNCNISQKVTFLGELNEIFLVHLNILPKL